MTGMEFEELLKIAVRYDIKHFCVGTTSVEFRELKEEVKFVQNSTPLAQTSIPVEGMPTEDELLHWSTDYVPPHRAEEKA